MLYDDYKYKKIWNSYYIVPTVIWFFFTVIFTLALIYELRIDSSLKSSIFIRFLIIIGGLFLLNLILCIILSYTYIYINNYL